MKRFIFSVAFALFAISCVSAQSPSAVQACAESSLPEGVRAALASQYAGWRIETFADLTNEYKKEWLEKHAAECPGIASGYFQEKNDFSYALLLIPQARRSLGFTLVVFSRKSGKGGYSAISLEQNDKAEPGGCTIFPVKPGKYFNEEKFSIFNLKSQAVYFEFYDSSGFIYYWKQGRFQRVAESD